MSSWIYYPYFFPPYFAYFRITVAIKENGLNNNPETNTTLRLIFFCKSVNILLKELVVFRYLGRCWAIKTIHHWLIDWLKDFMEQLQHGLNDSTPKAASDSYKNRQKYIQIIHTHNYMVHHIHTYIWLLIGYLEMYLYE